MFYNHGRLKGFLRLKGFMTMLVTTTLFVQNKALEALTRAFFFCASCRFYYYWSLFGADAAELFWLIVQSWCRGSLVGGLEGWRVGGLEERWLQSTIAFTRFITPCMRNFVVCILYIALVSGSRPRFCCLSPI